MKIILLSCVACALLLSGCTNRSAEVTSSAKTQSSEKSLLNQLHWLKGAWKGALPDGEMGESWTQLNDSTFAGRGFFLQGEDTVSTEELLLTQKGKDLFYIPTVKQQNNAMPVTFTLTYSDGNKWIFENPTHDFPQKITYTLLSDDSLTAEISALAEGKAHSQKFPMKRTRK